MKRATGPSLYFASDKNIFDALNQRQVKTQLVRDLFLDRGIIVSSETSKDDLAKYFSRLTADYFEHQQISMRLGSISKRERITSEELKAEIPEKCITEAFQELKNELAESGDIVHVSNDPVSGRIFAEISYTVVDYSKTELKQVQHRHAMVEFIKDPNIGYIVRSSQNDFTSIVVEKLISKISKKMGTQIERSVISLESYPDPKLRTQFFEQLVRSLADFDFVTMTQAFCYKPRDGVEKNDDGSDDDEGDETKPLESQPYIERVALRGKGVNRSFEIKNLYDNGFYIVKVVWQVQERRADGVVFEIEAQFSSPQSCSGFSHMVRSVLQCEDGKILDKKRTPSLTEQDHLSKIIEEASKNAFQLIAAAATSPK